MRVGNYVVVQACEEGWNYGPAALERMLASEEYGPYPTARAAEDAAIRETLVFELNLLTPEQRERLVAISKS